MYKALLKKFLQFSIGSWINIIVALATTPIITRIFIPLEYGKFSMYTLAINLLLIISLVGTDQSYMRYYSPENREQLLRKCISISITVSILISMFIIFFRYSFCQILFDEYTNLALILIIVGLFSQIILKFQQTDIRMRQNALLFSISNILIKVINVLITIIAAFLISKTYHSLVLGLVIGNLIVIIILKLSNSKSKKYINHKNENISYKDIFSYGFPYTFSLVVFWLFESFGKVALKYLADYNQVGIYAAAMKLVMIFSVVQNSFMNFWTPVAFEKYREDNKAHVFFNNMFLTVSFFLLILGNLIIMFSDFASILLGNEYKLSSEVLPFLIFAPILYTISETTVIGINFLKKTWYHLIIAIISCVVNIVLNAIFIPLFGAPGAAIATAIGYIVFFTLRTVISSKIYSVGYEVKKFYIGLLLLSLYAAYATFNSFSFTHVIFGILCICFTTYVYQNHVKKIILTLKKENRNDEKGSFSY